MQRANSNHSFFLYSSSSSSSLRRLATCGVGASVSYVLFSLVVSRVPASCLTAERETETTYFVSSLSLETNILLNIAAPPPRLRAPSASTIILCFPRRPPSLLHSSLLLAYLVPSSSSSSSSFQYSCVTSTSEYALAVSSLKHESEPRRQLHQRLSRRPPPHQHLCCRVLPYSPGPASPIDRSASISEQQTQGPLSPVLTTSLWLA